MTTTNPIVPPPELRRQWLDNDHFPMVTGTHDLLSITRDRLNSVMDQSAQWGADQELEACVEWLDRNGPVFGGFHLRIDRRPKPPSLKEQALAEVAGAVAGGNITPERGATIRRALEALDD